MPFVNFEQLIADRVDLPVGEIRTYYGETRLRAIEAELIAESTLRRSTVIRISGRTLVNPAHLETLAATGPVIALVIGLDAMLQRLHVSMGARYHNPEERALALGELKREWSLRGLSNVHEINTTYLTEEETIAQVMALWSSLTVVRG